MTADCLPVVLASSDGVLGVAHAGWRGLVGGVLENTLQAMRRRAVRSEEHTSELQSLMRISYAVFCLKKKTTITYLQLFSSSKCSRHNSNSFFTYTSNDR